MHLMIMIKNVAKIQHSLNKRIYSVLLALLLILPITACSSKSDKERKESELFSEKPKNPNPQEKAREFADKNSVFSIGRNKSGGTFEFSSSNVLWRASLKTLDFIPLNNTDYSGGVIVTDWYGNDEEQIKISVRFLSSELSSTAIKVIAHKKVCKLNNCKTEPANELFNDEIKNKILAEARNLKVEEEKKK